MTQEIKKESKFFATAGFTGLNRFGGNIDEEWLRKLQGRRGMATLREMSDNEPIIGAFLYGLLMFVRQADWQTRSADDSAPAREVNEFMHGVIFDDMALPFASVLTEALTMATFGWAALEIILKERRGPDAPFPHTSKFSDGRIGIRKLSPRSQDSLLEWVYDKHNELAGLKQLTDTGDEATIPYNKLLHFRTMSHKENPLGYSLLRRAVKPYYHKKKLEIIEGIGLERNLAGYPVIKVPGELLDPAATGDVAARRTAWENSVRDLRIDEQHGLLIPSDVDPETGQALYEVQLLSSQARPAETGPVITRYAREILQSVLADVIMIGHEQIGSFALASSKTELFIFGVASILDELAAPFNDVLIPKLMDLNGFDRALQPKLTYGDIEKMDLQVWAQAVDRLVKAGWTLPDDEKSGRYIRELLGLPDPGEGASVTDPHPPGGPKG